MAKKTTGGNDSYKRLTDSINNGRVGSLYIFHGDERYLLEHSLGAIRSSICPDGLSGFNYRRFEGKGVSADDIDDAVNTLPVFAERTLVEVHDFDVFNNADKQQRPEDKLRLIELLSDLPDYVCVVFIYDITPYKPDGRLKADKEILSKAHVVEFVLQEENLLVKWIARRFKDAGKLIGTSDCEYLIHITGGYMSPLQGEIGKIAAYAKDERVSRADIDAVVTPVLDAAAYKLTDALMRNESDTAMRILDELLRMREAPQKIIYSITSKMCRFLAARVCIENGLGIGSLTEMCGIKYEFQARMLMSTARKATLAGCRAAVLRCAETAFALNTAPEPEARLTELMAKLSYVLR